LAIGGLFSVVLVSDRSAWELPSALPMKSGLSSRSVAATSNHPVFSLAPEYYKAGNWWFQAEAMNRRSSEEEATRRLARPAWSGK
jgi:hypothetical protein